MKDVFNLGFIETSPMVIIDKLTTLKTKKSKIKVLQQAWDTDSERFFIGLQISMDESVDFKCKKVPVWDDDDTSEKLNFEKFYEFYMNVKHEILSEEVINDTILDLANESGSREWNLFYRNILLKKLQTILPMDVIIEFLSTIEKQYTNNIEDVSIILKR